MTRQLVCEGPCNGDAVRQYDAAHRRGDVTVCIEISRSLVHTPHKFARTIHDWLDIWACEQCGTERTC